jgi:hypothetical protein
MRKPGWLAVILFAFSCTNPGHVPRSVIPRDSMVNILWDILQADQFSTIYLMKDSGKIDIKAETIKLYQQVFQLHHVTKEEFDKSYRFYMAHPDISSVMFDTLAARANRKRYEIYKAPPKPLVK